MPAAAAAMAKEDYMYWTMQGRLMLKYLKLLVDGKSKSTSQRRGGGGKISPETLVRLSFMECNVSYVTS